MNFFKKRQKQVESQTNPSPKVPRHANLDGSGHAKRRAVLFSHDKKPEIRESSFVFDAGKQALANDGHDAAEAYSLMPRLRRATVFAATLLALSGALYMNGSFIITQLILHAGDNVLAGAMDISPGATAFALNQMQVGE